MKTEEQNACINSVYVCGLKVNFILLQKYQVYQMIQFKLYKQKSFSALKSLLLRLIYLVILR